MIMITDFLHLEYLKSGSPIQQKAYQVIKKLAIMEILQTHNPVLAGTLPLNIFIEGKSDLDILCYAPDLLHFENILQQFRSKKKFDLYRKHLGGIETSIARFEANGFKFEIVGQPINTIDQIAYRHMIVESRILQMKGENFKQEIIKLKMAGMKTEPAFAQLLKLEGDPYQSLLDLRL